MNKKPSIILTVSLLIFLFIQTESFAQSRTAAQPRLEPDPKALEYHRIVSGKSTYSWTELSEISLWASGDTALSNMQKISNAVSALNNSVDLPSSLKERAEYILNYMHTNILKTYSLYQTRVDTIFTNGRFNCVSSAVLYTILCRSAGINTSGVMTREHAFVIVHIDGHNIDVETTNRYGFDPGSRREFHDQFGQLTGFSYVPAQNYRDRQTINQIELISLIFINRITEHERANRFAEAVPVAIDRAVLLTGNKSSDNAPESTDTIFENPQKSLTDKLLNYGVSLIKSNREEAALSWIAAASEKYADPARWQELILTAVNNRITRFIKEKKPAEARNFLENNRLHLTQENYSHLDALMTDAELLSRAQNIRTAAEGEAVINDIDIAAKNKKLAERRAAEILTFAIQKTAVILSSPPEKNWRAAVLFLENALLRFGANRELEQNLQTYRGNLAVDYHNRFAAEWNKGNAEEAKRILNEGLAEFPGNRQLTADMEIVNKNSR